MQIRLPDGWQAALPSLQPLSQREKGFFYPRPLWERVARRAGVGCPYSRIGSEKKENEHAGDRDIQPDREGIAGYLFV